MTITTNPARNEYTANAGQTIFNYTFKIFENADLNVYVTPAGQDCSDSDLTTNYVVDPGTIGDPNGGFITLNTPTGQDDLVTIVSNVPSSRTTDYQNNGDFRPDTVNDDFDRVVSIAKKIEEKVGRTLQFEECLQNATDLSLPNPVAGLSVRWNGTENGMENYDPTSASTEDLLKDQLTVHYDTVLQMINDPSVTMGQKCRNKERSSALFDVISGTGTANGYNVIAHATLDLSFDLRIGDSVNLSEWGVSESLNDNTPVVQAGLAYGSSNNLPIIAPAGSYDFEGSLFVIRPSNDEIGIVIKGSARNQTIWNYTGTAATGWFFLLDVTGGFSLNNDISNIYFNMQSAPAGIGGFRINEGIWRSKFSDIRVIRKVSAKSDIGLSMGNETAGVGSYDNKFYNIYVGNFDVNVKFAGTELDGNTITNTLIQGSYIAGGATANLEVNWFNGFTMLASQLEAHEADGALFGDGDTAVIMGGSIESPEPGAVGINMNANTKSVVAICDFFNNAGGQFLDNGKPGHFYKTAQSGITLTPGGEVIATSDGTNFSRIRFFEDGIADVGIRVSNNGNAISFVDNDTDEERFKFDISNGILDIIPSGGYLRLQNDSEIRRLQGGVERREIWGSGSPEGVETANPGSKYWNYTGTAGSILWYKASGTGNTGWVAIA